MISLLISPFFLVDNNGEPLNGFVYVGSSGQNPVTNKISVYSDQALTQPVSQPLKVFNGSILIGGQRAPLWVSSDYSMLITDSNGAQVAYYPTVDTLVSILASSTGSQNIGFKSTVTGARQKTVYDKEQEAFSLADVWDITNSSSDASAAINNALSSGRTIIDGLGYTYSIASSLSIPLGVELKNINLINLTAGMNSVLLNHYSKFRGKITGTGTIGGAGSAFIERGLYPAVDGLHGTEVYAEITNLTDAAQLQDLTGTQPYSNYWNLTIHDIPGYPGQSEGYGALIVNAVNNILIIRAKNVQRHPLYFSAGASRNFAILVSDTNYHNALAFNAYIADPAVEENTVYAFVSNCKNGVGLSGFAIGADINQKCNRNRVYINCASSGNTDGAVRIQGVGTNTGPWPTDNIVHVIAQGTFVGAEVCASIDADNTIFESPIINGTATATDTGGANQALIRFNDSSGNTYTPKRAGAVHGGSLACTGGSIYGIINGAARGITHIGGDIDFRNCSQNVLDQTGTRTGINREYFTTYTFVNLANNANASHTLTIPDSFSNQLAEATIQGLSSATAGVYVYVTGTTTNTVTIACYNTSGSTQTVIVGVRFYGD